MANAAADTIGQTHGKMTCDGTKNAESGKKNSHKLKYRYLGFGKTTLTHYQTTKKTSSNKNR